MTHQITLKFSSTGRGTLGITDAVAKAVAESSVQCGVAHIFGKHTSCSLTIAENADADVRRDLETVMNRLVPDGDPVLGA